MLGLALLVDVQVFQAVGERMGDLSGSFGQDSVGDAGCRHGLDQVVLALTRSLAFCFLRAGGYLAVVAFDRGEGRVREAFG